MTNSDGSNGLVISKRRFYVHTQNIVEKCLFFQCFIWFFFFSVSFFICTRLPVTYYCMCIVLLVAQTPNIYTILLFHFVFVVVVVLLFMCDLLWLWHFRIDKTMCAGEWWNMTFYQASYLHYTWFIKHLFAYHWGGEFSKPIFAINSSI